LRALLHIGADVGPEVVQIVVVGAEVEAFDDVIGVGFDDGRQR
jgi:hypothetical protein